MQRDGALRLRALLNKLRVTPLSSLIVTSCLVAFIVQDCLGGFFSLLQVAQLLPTFQSEPRAVRGFCDFVQQRLWFGPIVSSFIQPPSCRGFYCAQVSKVLRQWLQLRCSLRRVGPSQEPIRGFCDFIQPPPFKGFYCAKSPKSFAFLKGRTPLLLATHWSKPRADSGLL